jgi:hypothetical protein
MTQLGLGRSRFFSMAAGWATAMGSRADLRLAESVSATARSLRKRADIHEAFLACAFICRNALERYGAEAIG